jgi:hypothetical protein
MLARVAQEIATKELDHLRGAAAVPSEVHDDGVGIRQEAHSPDGSVLGARVIAERIEPQVPDVAREDLDLHESIVRGPAPSLLEFDGLFVELLPVTLRKVLKRVKGRPDPILARASHLTAVSIRE